MERYAMYLRKSRAEEQTGTEETLLRHRQQLLLLAEKRGIRFGEGDIYEEVASGESLCCRPRMLALLEAVERGEYAAVLVMDIDRLGRGGMREQGIILDAFKYSGTRIVTPEKDYDLEDELDETATELKTFLSRQEYKAIKKRLQRGLRQTIRDGGYIANAPYGYRRAYQNKKPTLQVEAQEAGFVRLIFNLYVQERLGSSAIAETLNALGARPRRAERFGRTTVAGILKNPVYTGKIVWDKKKCLHTGIQGEGKKALRQPPERWTVAEGLHPAIIEEEVFARAQQLMHERAHPPARPRGLRNPLAGLVRCRACGGGMQRQAGETPYLLCPKKGCAAAAKLKSVERALLEGLRERMARIQLPPASPPAWDAGPLAQGLSAIRSERERLEGQRERLYDLLEQGVYDAKTYRERMAQLQERIRQGGEREQALQEELAKERQPISLLPPLQTVWEAYLAADERQRNQLLKSMVVEIVYDKRKGSGPEDFRLLVRLKGF